MPRMKSFNIAGEFKSGTKLSNGGEIVLVDASGETIHDFSYEDNYRLRMAQFFNLHQ